MEAQDEASLTIRGVLRIHASDPRGPAATENSPAWVRAWIRATDKAEGTAPPRARSFQPLRMDSPQRGGGLAVSIAKHIAFKPIQLEYVMSQPPHFGTNTSSIQNSLRYSAGLVPRLGAK
jgi:hypothetical protein